MHPVHICACVVLLVVIASSASEEGVTVQITGPVRVIISGRDGNCFNGTTQEGHGSQLDVVEPKHDHGCPDGFVKSTGSEQCFKLFKDKQRRWYDAKKKCESEGLHLAEPSPDVAVALRKDLLDIYGHDDGISAWLGAKADGWSWKWQRRSTTLLASSNPLWYPGAGDDTNSARCLDLLLVTHTWIKHPEKPYSGGWCSYGLGLYTLCEV